MKPCLYGEKDIGNALIKEGHWIPSIWDLVKKKKKMPMYNRDNSTTKLEKNNK